MQATLEEVAVDALLDHDWYFEYSDDPRIGENGFKERRAIAKSLRALDARTAALLWKQYAPCGNEHNFSFFDAFVNPAYARERGDIQGYYDVECDGTCGDGSFMC